MEADYLKRTIGFCLADGLAELAAKKPADPIEYLALWMLKYKQNSLQRTKDGDLPVVRIEGETSDTVVDLSAKVSGGKEEQEAKAAVPAEERTPPPPPSMPRIDEVEEEGG